MILQRIVRSAAVAAVALAVVGTAGAQLLDDPLSDRIDSALEDALSQAAESRIDRMLDSTASDALDELSESAREALEQVEEIVPVDEEFVTGIDAQGDPIERGVWVVLVTPEQLERIERRGFVIRERRVLAELGRVLLRIESPEEPRAAKRALRRAMRTSGVQIDSNHIYRPQIEDAGDAARPAEGAGSSSADAGSAETLSIAMIDSAVAAGHEALRSAAIVQRDFVPAGRTPQVAHGTAVASLLVGDSPSMRGQLPGARLFAASVFFEDDAGASVATTSSLILALDWAAGSGARVINMSLSGPANRVLESAVRQLIDRGLVVVAAVGNDGPAAPPRYPAAYEQVVGITAVDGQDGIYRYANRGRHVTFAAPGVEVTVAAGNGGYVKQSGTSMAAPHAAAILARLLDASGKSPQRVLAALKRQAVDLGPRGFDETFGFGRITTVPTP